MTATDARGDHALGECARSGRVMALQDMVDDGLYPGLKVDPDWWEPAYPLAGWQPAADPVALQAPAPRREAIDATVRFPGFDVASGRRGAELFTRINRAGVDASLAVALYAGPPGDDYAAAGEVVAAGYTAGGQPLDAERDGQTLAIAPSAWPNADIAASHALIYAPATGRGLLRVAFGAVRASTAGRFRVAWDSARFILTADGARLARVIA